MADDKQWLTEKHYLVCPKGMMFKQMKVTSQNQVYFSGHLAATTADTMKTSNFTCIGSTAFAAGAAAGLACLLIPGPGWLMAGIIALAILAAIGIGYLKCKAAAATRIWINQSPNLIIHGNNGLVVGQSKLNCPAEGAQVDIKETFWEAMLSTTMNNVGHIANFAFGFLAGRGAGSLMQIAGRQGLKAAGAEMLHVAKSEMGAMFNPATLFGKMGTFCRVMRGLGMFGAYKGQYDIWTDEERTVPEKILASGGELILAIFAAKGATTVCFPAGTKVHGANGLVNIETLQIGDTVWTMNERTGEREMKPVLQTHRRTTLQMMVVQLENGIIFEVTPEHRFFVNNGWQEARELGGLEELELIEGSKVKIAEIGLTVKTATVFNFDVADNENYFVTDAGVLVHNGYREDYMGRTPGKNSRTGREVFDRMLNENPPTARVVDDFGNPVKEFWDPDNQVWRDVSEADMGHLHDCVTWWNTTGRAHGAKAPEVREWMLKSDNYVYEYYSTNRSKGATLGQTANYLPPLVP